MYSDCAASTPAMLSAKEIQNEPTAMKSIRFQLCRRNARRLLAVL